MIEEAAVKQIDSQSLEAMLSDPDVPESELRPYLKLDPSDSKSFEPRIVPNPARVAFDATEAAVAVSSLNGVSRWRRQVLYRRKIKNWAGLRVVAEGDSWFQYPFLIDDVVDHLFQPWAIYCVSGAGDLLSDMARQDEVTAAVIAEQPDVLILSGGGNDLLGDGKLVNYLKPHAAGMAPADYVTGKFDDMVATNATIYGELVSKALTAGARRIVCHSYDYVIPHSGRWLGRPMLKLGITDKLTQRAIIRILIDRFHSTLTAMAAGFGGKVAIADCRGAVADNEWYDELHPTSAGFAKVARIFRAAAEGVEVESLPAAALEATEIPRPLPIADAAAVEALFDASPEALLAEIGRRSAILDLSPDAANTYALELPAGGTESTLPFMDLGARIFDRLHRELYQLLCGDGGKSNAERDKLRQALPLDQAAIIGAVTSALIALSVPILIAPLVAALVVKSGIDPAWEVTCRFWGEKLGEV